MTNIGSFIRQKRQEKNLSVRQLASYTGVSAAYISQLENNYRKNPTAHVLRSLADGLAIDYDDFLFQLEQLTKEELKERRNFYERYIDNKTTNVTLTHKDINHPIDLYDLLMETKTLHYKGNELSEINKSKIITMLETLLE